MPLARFYSLSSVLTLALGVLPIVLAIALASTPAQAQDKRYLNFHHATHISAGWVALDNGQLYACRLTTQVESLKASCTEASGLPASMQRVSALWGEDNMAWVAYTDGNVYGCVRQDKANGGKPHCIAATGIP